MISLAAIASVLQLPGLIRNRSQEQWLSAAEIAQLRDTRLMRLLQIARRARYYAKTLPNAAAEPLTSSRVRELPILTKAILAAEGADAFLTGDSRGLLKVTTSGSTGEPSLFYRTPLEEAEFSARWWRVWAAYGAGPRDSMFKVGRSAPPRSGAVTTLRNLGILPRILNVSVSDPIERNVKILCEFKPKLVTGFAIGIEAMAQYMLERGVRIPPPKLVICGAMDVTEHCRDVVREAFGAPAVNVYATNEFGVIAWECPANRGALHVNEDVFVMEVLNGDQPVADGAPGELVLTALTLHRMPLIRLRVGDIAARLKSACACGRGLACMTPVHGRTTHAIRGPCGRLFTAPLFASAFSACGAYDWVRRFQIQERQESILCAVVVPTRLPSESEQRALLAALREVTGGSFTVELELRDELPLAPTGKFQYVLPKVPMAHTQEGER